MKLCRPLLALVNHRGPSATWFSHMMLAEPPLLYGVATRLGITHHHVEKRPTALEPDFKDDQVQNWEPRCKRRRSGSPHDETVQAPPRLSKSPRAICKLVFPHDACRASLALRGSDSARQNAPSCGKTTDSAEQTETEKWSRDDSKAGLLKQTVRLDTPDAALRATEACNYLK
jgi:hypothetical protein